MFLHLSGLTPADGDPGSAPESLPVGQPQSVFLLDEEDLDFRHAVAPAHSLYPALVPDDRVRKSLVVKHLVLYLHYQIIFSAKAKWKIVVDNI